ERVGRLVRGPHDLGRRDGDAMVTQDLTGLVFVDLHRPPSVISCPRTDKRTIEASRAGQRRISRELPRYGSGTETPPSADDPLQRPVDVWSSGAVADGRVVAPAASNR